MKSQGKIVRTANHVTADADTLMDVVGRCDLIMNGTVHDTICLMDLGMYVEGIVSEQFLNRYGQTILWRRFNRDDWAMDRYGKTWSELLPENEQLIVNEHRYVHWYDCLCIR